MSSSSTRTPTRAVQSKADRQRIAATHRRLREEAVNDADRHLILEAYVSKDRNVHMTRKDAMIKLGMSSNKCFKKLVQEYNLNGTLRLGSSPGRKPILSKGQHAQLAVDIVDRTVNLGGFKNKEAFKEYIMPQIRASAVENKTIANPNVSA